MPTAAVLLHLSVVILAEYTYRKIAKIPRPLLYLEFEHNWRKYAKKHTMLFSKIFNITLIINIEFLLQRRVVFAILRYYKYIHCYLILHYWVATIKMSCWTISFEDIFLFLSEWNTILKQSFPGRLYYGLVLNVYEICS